MNRCSKCVLPESFPGIEFDSNNICLICNQTKEQNRFFHEKLKTKMHEVIKQNKKPDNSYDALVAYSGGKDSSFLVHQLTKEYKLKVLAFTFDNGYLSDRSFDNMKRVLDHLSVDHIIYKPNRHLLKEIFSVSAKEDIYPLSLLKFGSAICISCIRMVTNFSLRTAIEKDIPMVMIGNSPGQILQSENEIIYKDNRIPYALRKNLFKPLAEKIGSKVYHYLTLPKVLYQKKPFPFTINPFPIIGYDESEIYRTIQQIGWQRPADVDPNTSNCRLNAVGIHIHKQRYGFHPYDYEMSTLVRMGIISRHTALRRVEDSENTTQKICNEIIIDLKL